MKRPPKFKVGDLVTYPNTKYIILQILDTGLDETTQQNIYLVKCKITDNEIWRGENELQLINEPQFKNEFYGELVEKNTYTIKTKFQIGETVKRANPPYRGTPYLKISSIEPRITKDDIQVYYRCGNGFDLYHESQLKKVEA